MIGMGSSCGACKFLRRKCMNDCVFAPYFCYDEAATHFAAVHKVFGASNVSKLLLHLPVQNRSDAAITISYEALARMQDPIYGCVAHIFALQQQIASLQEEIDILEHQMANFTVGIASCGSSQTTSNPNCEMRISSLQDAINMQYYQNQSAAQASNSGYVTGNQAFDSQMDAQLSLMHEWEEPNPSCQSHPNPLDRLLEDLDQDIFPFCPWLDSGNTAK